MDARLRVTLICMAIGVIVGTLSMIAGVVSYFRNREKTYVYCDSLVLCPRKIRDNWWGHFRAFGWWFSPKDNIAFCPTHVPENIFVWRKHSEDY